MGINYREAGIDGSDDGTVPQETKQFVYQGVGAGSKSGGRVLTTNDSMILQTEVQEGIFLELQQLDEAMNDLEKIVVALIGKLTPVLTPEALDAEGCSVGEAFNKSPVAQRISCVSSSARALESVIGDVIRRVEL